MIPYLTVLFLASVVVYGGRRFGSVSVRRTSILIVALLLTIFAGIRAPNVGTDTGTYIRIYGQIDSVDDLTRTTELGYNSLMVLSSSLSDHYTILLIVIALVVVSCYLSGIALMAKRYETALFLFIALGSYTFLFNGARQAIAASICFLALHWLLDRRPSLYFVAVFIASLFHHSALIALPLYFVSSPRLSKWYLVSIAVGAVTLTSFLGFFVNIAAELINDRYAYYAQEDKGGGEVLATFLVGQGLILYVLRSRVRSDLIVNYNRLLSLYLLGLIPVVASVIANVHASGIMRLHFYFTHCAILLWPMFFYSWKKTVNRHIFSAVFFIIVLLFYIMTTMSFADLYPYRFNPAILW